MKSNKILRIALLAVAGVLCAVSLLFIILASTAPKNGDKTEQATVLDIPAGLTYADGAFTWNVVKGAKGYVLKLNGTENQTQTNRYELGDDEYGELTAYVKAIGGGSVRDSSFSAAVKATRIRPVLPLSAPTGLTYGGGLLTWAAVENAVSYEIVIGENSFTTTETYYLLPSSISGDCVAKVKAVGDGVGYSNSEYSAEFAFTVLDTTVKTTATPAFFRFDKENKLFKWEKVNGADGYLLTVNGGEPIALNAYATQYAWTGATEFTASIAAKDGDSISEESVITVIGGITEIATEDEFFAMQPNGDYKLVENITLTKAWKPINFYGSFDGNGKTISGLFVRSAAEYVGLFGAAIDAEIKNVTIENATVQAELQSGLGELGVLCGRLENSVVENCKVSATVTAIHYTVGGLIGALADGEVASVTGCSASCALTLVGGGYAGGLIGEIRVNTAVVETSFAVGSIDAEFAAGGFVGYVGYGEIENCYASVQISLNENGNAVGGFIATLQGRNVSVSACYSACSVVYSGDGAAAGFVGIAPGGDYGGYIFKNCYFDNTVYALNGKAVGNNGSANGISASSDLKNGALPSGFDGQIWQVKNGEYPALA